MTAAYLIYDFGCCLFDKQVRIDNLVHHLVCVVGIGAGFAYKLVNIFSPKLQVLFSFFPN